MKPPAWLCRGRRITFDRPLILGILNVTPDSFSDGGRYVDPAVAVARAEQLLAHGADILDIGGESTRPGAEPVTLDDELQRVIPVIEALTRRAEFVISIDTMKAEVARQALRAGACIVNDVSGLRDPQMVGVCAEFAAGVIVMHMKGTPQTMHLDPTYTDVLRTVDDFFEERLRTLPTLGVSKESIVFDPGIGFGKGTIDNLDLIANMNRLTRHGRPICLGVSRKGFIGKLCGHERAEDRAIGSAAVAAYALTQGTAHLVRVHDVAVTKDTVTMIQAIHEQRREPT